MLDLEFLVSAKWLCLIKIMEKNVIILAQSLCNLMMGCRWIFKAFVLEHKHHLDNLCKSTICFVQLFVWHYIMQHLVVLFAVK